MSVTLIFYTVGNTQVNFSFCFTHLSSESSSSGLVSFLCYHWVSMQSSKILGVMPFYLFTVYFSFVLFVVFCLLMISWTHSFGQSPKVHQHMWKIVLYLLTPLCSTRACKLWGVHREWKSLFLSRIDLQEQLVNHYSTEKSFVYHNAKERGIRMRRFIWLIFKCRCFVECHICFLPGLEYRHLSTGKYS